MTTDRLDLDLLAGLALDDTAPEPFRLDLARIIDRTKHALGLATEATVAARAALEQRDAARRDAVADLIDQLDGKKPNPNPLAIIENRDHLDRRHAQAVEVAALTTAAVNRLTADATAGVFTRHAADLLPWVAAWRHAHPLPEPSSPGHRYAWDRIGSRFLIEYPLATFADRDTPPNATPLALDVVVPSDLADRTQYAWDAIATGRCHLTSTTHGRGFIRPLAPWDERRPVDTAPTAGERSTGRPRPMFARAR